jgi:septum formation protein
LLASLGVPLVVVRADVDESEAPGEAPERYLERVTASKLARAREVAPPEGAAIIVADTIVTADGRILGKPRDDAEAVETLRRIAGRSHAVMTRFAVAVGDSVLARTVRTDVGVRELSEPELGAYVKSGEGADKAGAYAIQGRFGLAIRSISGSYTNVVGLPVAEVVEALVELGVVDLATLLAGSRLDAE